MATGRNDVRKSEKQQGEFDEGEEEWTQNTDIVSPGGTSLYSTKGWCFRAEVIILIDK